MNACKTVIALAMAASITAHAENAPVKPSGPAPVPAAAQVPPAPLTIGELAAQARQKRIADETKPAAPVVPAGMNIVVPSTSILGPAAAAGTAEKAPKKKEKPAPPPEIVPGLKAIAKAPNGTLYAELADSNGTGKYVSGQVTPSGWAVAAIGTHYVELSKPAANKKPARRLSLSLVAQ